MASAQGIQVFRGPGVESKRGSEETSKQTRGSAFPGDDLLIGCLPEGGVPALMPADAPQQTVGLFFFFFLGQGVSKLTS